MSDVHSEPGRPRPRRVGAKRPKHSAENFAECSADAGGETPRLTFNCCLYPALRRRITVSSVAQSSIDAAIGSGNIGDARCPTRRLPAPSH